jgi:tellurite methyltransferase
MLSIPNNPVGDWTDYFASTLSKPLHPLFAELEPYLPESGRALDLGCGVGHAVVWLAEKGWEVRAVDGHSEALDILRSRLGSQARVEIEYNRLEDVQVPSEHYDLIVAAYSLFFIESHETLGRVWSDIWNGLKPGGLFVGEFLGSNDDWADLFLTHTSADVASMLQGWKVLHLEEAEQDGHTSQGTEKHWHVFHVIARK